MKIKSKIIKKRMEKTCSLCGKEINVVLYEDRLYRGGHYFGKVPVCSKKEMAKAMKFGTRVSKVGGAEFQVFKKDPKPYKFFEYWECPKCYWRPTTD